jgi:hypothetical protein
MQIEGEQLRLRIAEHPAQATICVDDAIGGGRSDQNPFIDSVDEGAEALWPRLKPRSCFGIDPWHCTHPTNSIALCHRSVNTSLSLKAR